MKVYRGQWNPETVYSDKDGVYHKGTYYFAKYPTTGRAPDRYPDWWQECDPPPDGTIPVPRPSVARKKPKAKKTGGEKTAPPTGEIWPFAG